MEIKCNRCRKMHPEEDFLIHPNGERYKFCKKCTDEQTARREEEYSRRREEEEKKRLKALEQMQEVKPKKKLNFEEEMEKISKTGLSYSEYQMLETKRLAGMSR